MFYFSFISLADILVASIFGNYNKLLSVIIDRFYGYALSTLGKILTAMIAGLYDKSIFGFLRSDCFFT